MSNINQEEIETLCKLIREESIENGWPLKVAAVSMTVKMLEDVAVEAMRSLFPTHGELTDVALNIAANFASIRITEATIAGELNPKDFLGMLTAFMEATADSTIRRTIAEKRERAANDGASDEELAAVAGMAKDIISKVMH